MTYFWQIYRCKMVENLLRKSGVQVWSFRRIFNYARKRGYIPFPSILTMKRKLDVGKAIALRPFPYQRNCVVLKKKKRRRGCKTANSSENKDFKNVFNAPTQILEYIRLNDTFTESNEDIEILYLDRVSGKFSSKIIADGLIF